LQGLSRQNPKDNRHDCQAEQEVAIMYRVCWIAEDGTTRRSTERYTRWGADAVIRTMRKIGVKAWIELDNTPSKDYPATRI